MAKKSSVFLVLDEFCLFLMNLKKIYKQSERDYAVWSLTSHDHNPISTSLQTSCKHQKFTESKSIK